MLNWARLDPESVERAIKALLRELFPAAQGISGAGGDGGRDVVLRVDGGVRVFEIKSFAATLSGSQKRQIERSLQTALQPGDVRGWTLVLPHDPTPSELEWFNQVLSAKAPAVDMQWYGRDWLDNMFAPRIDLRRYIEGPDAELLERAKVFNQETSVLGGGIPDLASRQVALGSLADELSPFWRPIPSLTPDGHAQIEITEKHPGDADRDPITFNVRFATDVANTSLSQFEQAYQQVVDFGGHVAIPGAFLAGLDLTTSVQTSALFAAMTTTPLTEIAITSLPDTTELGGTLQAIDSSGAVICSTVITFLERHRGLRGMTAIARDISGLLTIQLQAADVEGDGQASSHLKLKMFPSAGEQPERIEQTLAVLVAIEQGARLRLRVGPATILTVDVPPDEGRRSAVEALTELVRALATLQEHVEQIIPVPAELSARDHENLQIIAKAVRGEWVKLCEDLWTPEVDPERLAEFFEQWDSAGNGIRMDLDGLFDLEGTTYKLGPIAYVAAGLRLLNRADLEAQASAGHPLIARFKAESGIWLMPIPSAAHDEAVLAPGP